jgi:hypothetical protein
MNDELLNAASVRFQNLSEAEKRMLRAVKSESAVCGSDDDDFNAANNPQCGALWDETRTIRADVIVWLCINAAVLGRSANDGVYLYGAKIEGILDLSYVDIHLPFCFERCYFTHEIWLKNAKIPSLNLTGCWTKQIRADGLQVASHVWFGSGFHSMGEVLFRDANIGGSFDVVGATFEYAPSSVSRTKSANSLGCDRIKISGGMFLYSSLFKGEVGLAGASVGSNLECDGSTFENLLNAPDGHRYAIRADRITVNGGIFLRSKQVCNEGVCQLHRFSVKGAVRFINANMGVLDCTAAVIEGDGISGFCAESARISDKAVFDEFAISNGGIELRALTAGDVSFRCAKVTTVDLRFAVISRALRFRQIHDAAHSLWDLRNASVGSLDDDEESWPPQGRLFINGFEYQSFGSLSFDRPGKFSKAPLDFRLRKQWIERDIYCPPHAYRQLANAYSKSGNTRMARQARYCLEELLRSGVVRESRWPLQKPLVWVWQHMLKWTTGYGYKLWLSVVWMGVLLIVGCALSYWGYLAHTITPTSQEACRFFAKYGYAPNGYPPFRAVAFAVENLLPTLSFSVSDHWAACGRLWNWFVIQKILGWILSFLFVTGITGLSKSDK